MARIRETIFETMGVYEDNIVPVKSADLAEYIAKVKKVSLRLWFTSILIQCTRNSTMRERDGGI